MTNRPIHDSWVQFCLKVFPDVADAQSTDPTRHEQLRLAFFAGAGSAIWFLNAAGEQSDESAEAAIKAVNHECREFLDRFNKGVSR